MITYTFLMLFFSWYVYNYGVPFTLWNLFFKLDNLASVTFEKVVYLFSLFYNKDDDDDEYITNTNSEKDGRMVEERVEPKYEDKYLEHVREMNKEWDFKAPEIAEQMDLSQKIFNESKEKVMSRIDELQTDIAKLDKETKQDTGLDDEYYYDNEEGDELLQKTTFEERCAYRTRKVDELQKELDDLLQAVGSQDGTRELMLDAEKQSMDHIIGKRIDKLANCFIMETTPLGNVLMIYNKDRESFAYYSDSNIPYRYLEPVARKYVKSFNCRPLYIDMEEELKLIEEKWDKDQEMKRLKEEEDSKRIAELVASGITSLEKAADSNKKKNVFAKLKSYNKDAGGGGKISMAAPPKNSIPGNPVVPETKENAKILLKERANRYTYEGKFANFSFLKKVERKVFNKKLALTFAEFKSML